MVYTDRTHLTADTECELHSFAESIGLKREWFQNHRHKHYDLTTKNKADKAIKAGAKLITARQIILMKKKDLRQ